MPDLRCVLLLVTCYVVVTDGKAQTFINYSGGTADPCSPSPCGRNTRCTVNHRGVGVCRCLDGFFPKPNTIAGCGPQCITDSECGSPRFVCQNQKCVNPCVDGSPCGLNANCDVRNHQVVCSCPPGYEGNAYTSCYPSQTSVRSSVFSHSSVHTPAVIGRGNSQSAPRAAPPAPPSDPCASGSVCGVNARCDPVNGRAVCSCPAGHIGDPLTGCRRGECTHDTECPHHKACIDVKCQNPCALGECGIDAKCAVENHRAICSCPQNYIGDPLTRCRYDPEAACTPSPCGTNTNCRVQGGRAVCSCIDDYIGNPLSACRPECVADTECLATQSCVKNRCKNACTGACGNAALCNAVNHRAVCTCPQYYRGDGITGCYPECTTHAECRNNQACINLQCSDPCLDACGTGAECQVIDHKAICKCPKGFDGHPFQGCYPAAPRDMCVPNPCGANAECNHGSDRSGNPRPVCTCPRGYLGDPLTSCRRGECVDSSECSSTKACYNFRCVSPCVDSGGVSVCGTNAVCDASGHKAVCSCPREYTGDPLLECRLKPIARSNTGGRFKRTPFLL